MKKVLFGVLAVLGLFSLAALYALTKFDEQEETQHQRRNG